MADSVNSTPVPANGVLYGITRTQPYAITPQSGDSAKQQAKGTAQ
jgi:hypothetical protein